MINPWQRVIRKISVIWIILNKTLSSFPTPTHIPFLCYRHILMQQSNRKTAKIIVLGFMVLMYAGNKSDFLKMWHMALWLAASLGMVWTQSVPASILLTFFLTRNLVLSRHASMYICSYVRIHASKHPPYSHTLHQTKPYASRHISWVTLIYRQQFLLSCCLKSWINIQSYLKLPVICFNMQTGNPAKG